MDEVSKTVTTTSDGTVTIAVERYHELLRDAAAKAPIIQTIVHKTPEIQAKDNKSSGVALMLVGAGTFVAGAVKFTTGVRQLKALNL